MDESRRHKVSLRGASSGEISRDALLAKVSQERELRNYVKRANAAAQFIQRVWRRYNVTKKVALHLQEGWESMLNHYADPKTRNWIACSMLRPFLYFIAWISIRHRKIQRRDIICIQNCFKMLLESMSSPDPKCNFCLLAVGTFEERRIWTYQTQKLISLCSFLLSVCDGSCERNRDVNRTMPLVLRIVVLLTDPKGWKCITDDNNQDAEMAAKLLVLFLGSHRSGYYMAMRTYIITLDINVPFSSSKSSTDIMDDKLLIITSAITLALRPFHTTTIGAIGPCQLDTESAVGEYCSSVLTIPWLVRRLPTILVPALKHKTILLPCFRTLLISKEKILSKMLDMERLGTKNISKMIPGVGWALGNVISLAAGNEDDFVDSHGLNQPLFYASYVRVVIMLAEDFLAWLNNVRRQDNHGSLETSSVSTGEIVNEAEATERFVNITYVESFGPICQQWHLLKLLAVSKKDAYFSADQEGSEKVEPFEIAHYYSYMLRIFSVLNPLVGPLPVLNMLSFTPGYLVSLWSSLEVTIFPETHHRNDGSQGKACASNDKKHSVSDQKQKRINKDGGNKWTNVLQKFAGKSLAAQESMDLTGDKPRQSQVNEDLSDVWDVKTLRHGPKSISKDMSSLLHLFCATYSHLLFVLDDLEFYEKQAPFVLEQQRRIASVLNTLVYNALLHGVGSENRPLMDSAVRCLHLMYDRDCRHPFCPPGLWLSPGRLSRPQIAVAARTRVEVSSANMRSDDASAVWGAGSIISITPHVFPFDERVLMFREFISMDKVSRAMAGEVDGPGSRSIEIVVRRGHIIEDGFRQLNNLGSRLKSSIHVSFVSECGLQEAGLDYGGLSKELLTDLSKAAFAPEYGLFSQTSTSDRLLIPNPAARHLENGIQMIEFLGRIVGKALYEGILLDYSFSHVFVQKLLGRYSFLDELSTLDPELYKNLMYVKQSVIMLLDMTLRNLKGDLALRKLNRCRMLQHYDGDVEEFCLDFSVTEESFGRRYLVELKAGGRDISVTNENKMQYIHAMADYKLNRQILPFANAFYRGLTDLISPSWLKLFNAREFNQLLSGGNHDIDVDDLRNNTKYTGGYSAGSRTIRIFWEVMKGFEPKARCMLLKFVTSCSRAPLLGFKYLQPTFTIHKVTGDTSLWAAFGGQDIDRLPSASTCYNTLKLPTYKRTSTMREKLLYAISSNAGFELS